MPPDVPDDLACDREHLLPALVDGVLPLDVGCRYEHVDHVDIAVDAGIHVGFDRPGESADVRGKAELLDGGNGLFLGSR